MTTFPSVRPAHPGPAEGLRRHAASLRAHAERLRTAAADLRWEGDQGDAFRTRTAQLADRCTRAADSLALAARRLEDPGGR